MTDLSSGSSENLGASKDKPDVNWEVQDILAERKTISGETEMLVDWKCTWIPMASVKYGPVLVKWQHTNKFKTGHGTMDVTLPVIQGTQLHADCIIIRKNLAEKTVQVKHTDNTAEPSTPSSTHVITGSKKQTGSAAKRRRA